MKNQLSDINASQGNCQSDQDDDDIDLGGLIATILDGKYIIAFVSLFFLLAGVAKALLDTPIYKADGMLQIEEKANTLNALESVTPLLESKMPALTEIEIIKSRKVLGQAVKNLNLEIIAKPTYFPIIGEAFARHFQKQAVDNQVAVPLFGKDQYAWGGEMIRVDTFSIPETWIGKEFTLQAGIQGHFTLLDNGQALLNGEVGKPIIKPLSGGQGTLSLFVPLLKARPNTLFTVMRRSLLSGINELTDSFSVVEKGKNTGILSFTMESASPILAVQTLNEVANIYVKQNVEQKSKEAQSTLEFLDKQLPVLKDQLEASTNALNEFRINKGSIDLDIETQSVLEGVVEIKTQITLLQQKRDELRGRFTESHPTIIAIDKQITRLQAQMNVNDRKIEALPEIQQVILRLSRDVKVSTELYTTLLNSAQTLRVAKAGTVGNARVIDEAILPTSPIKPKKPLIIGISLILGLIVGVAIVFVRKALHQGIEDPDQIEKHLNIPVYATISHSNRQVRLSEKLKKSGKNTSNEVCILALENKEDLAIESLRSLRTTLHFAFLEAQNNIIMITGPSPGVGKSFVCINLATVLADAGKKILLIDGDLRNGFINKSLGVSRENGLSELITQTTALDKAIRIITAANIDFISTGAIPPNPSELLLHERFGTLLEALSKNYDHIIIDSPPVLAVTDACIIGRMASATLMVVKAGQHPMRELEQSAKRLIQAGVHIKGVVFNDLPLSSSRYGYGYGYGKYVYRYHYQSAN
ncbi:polysaccharide biosynthesis tyrosine autokinase [Methylovulum psychrotolerans]|uniref:polysaccharide biosynthesis tyrosine autokinase n=1 Tax=Methylovulum psychrotolerans TaxID=1704499 RepID=UPI001BFFBF38|nr:polysaccharide biosynthesis tyrosine autokinase [Methylovulum psychrotolerans]MBT9099531.1 polysaccharide biosynthesis tyrosine autokinase [Methylovulum psychrotolerans]